MTSFQTSLIKGEIGEKIVRKYLEDKGWIIYSPITKDKAHYFDMLCTFNKDLVIAIDVKTKARLNNWNAQGINKKSYFEYLKFTKDTNINFYLVFIDDKNGEVYAADINKLINPIYPNNNLIAWELKNMKFLFKIDVDEIHNLTKYDQREYIYNPS